MNQLHLIKAIIGTFLLKGIADAHPYDLSSCPILSWYKSSTQIGPTIFRVSVDCSSKLKAIPQSPPPAPLTWQQPANLDWLLSTV